MDERELRKWLAKQLEVQDVPHELWDYLVKKHYVSDALELEADGRAVLLREARDQRARAQALAREETWGELRVRTRHFTADLGASAMARTRAEAEAVALAVTRDEGVRRFRERYLEGRMLSLSEAEQLVTSPAAAFLFAESFTELGIPVIGHCSQDRGGRRFLRADGWLEIEIDLQITWTDGSLATTARCGGNWSFLDRHPDLMVATATDEPVLVHIWRHSLLDRLRELSETIAKLYGWEVEHAAWFILTATPPQRDPLEAHITLRSPPALASNRVTLSIAPWMPASIVEQTFRAIQQDLLGKENRPHTERTLVLLQFVLAQERQAAQDPDPDQARLTWAELMARWNAAHPERAYRKERLFARDVNRTRRAVEAPKYRFGTENEEGAKS
jgi:hypothetical protein